MPDFYGWLETSGWMCFAQEPIKANDSMVREFYANAAETNFTGDVVPIVWGRQVHFDSTTINALYGLPDANNDIYRARAREEGHEWFVSHIHDGHRPQWIASNLRMDSSEFIAEAKMWLSIIYSRIILSKNDSDVSIDRVMMMCAIMEGFDINVGELIVQQVSEVVVGGTKSLYFPYLSTRLFQAAGIDQRDTDRFKNPETPIHPLKKKGPGNVMKKWKIDILDSAFGTFVEGSAPTDSQSTSSSVGSLQRGPLALFHISG